MVLYLKEAKYPMVHGYYISMLQSHLYCLAKGCAVLLVLRFAEQNSNDGSYIDPYHKE